MQNILCHLLYLLPKNALRGRLNMTGDLLADVQNAQRYLREYESEVAA